MLLEPLRGKMQFRSQFFWNRVSVEISGLCDQVLEDGAKVIELLSGSGCGDAFFVPESLAESSLLH